MIELEHVVLRPVEHTDLPSLYEFRNDAEVVRHLSGFSAGYSNAGAVERLFPLRSCSASFIERGKLYFGQMQRILFNAWIRGKSSLKVSFK